MWVDICFAASLLALGLNGIQVFISLLLGISIVLVFANLMGKPGQKAGVPFPVVARMSFGVFGANISSHHSWLDRGRLVRYSNLSGV